MKLVTWKAVAIVLAIVCCVQRWQSCTRTESHPATQRQLRDGDERSATAAPSPSSLATTRAALRVLGGDEPAATKSWFGLKPPAWVQRLLPQPGETMRAYRDRVLPIAQLAIAPQRARVARMRDKLVTLDHHQREELDAATAEAANAIEQRVVDAIGNGELTTAIKPMQGIAMAREVLDIVDRGNTRFLMSLGPDQRAELAASRFDFADYLLFSTKWEDALPR